MLLRYYVTPQNKFDRNVMRVLIVSVILEIWIHGARCIIGLGEHNSHPQSQVGEFTTPTPKAKSNHRIQCLVELKPLATTCLRMRVRIQYLSMFSRWCFLFRYMYFVGCDSSNHPLRCIVLLLVLVCVVRYYRYLYRLLDAIMYL